MTTLEEIALALIAGLLGFGGGVKLGGKGKVDVGMCDLRHKSLERYLEAHFKNLIYEIRRMNGGQTGDM